MISSYNKVVTFDLVKGKIDFIFEKFRLDGQKLGTKKIVTMPFEEDWRN